MAHDKRFKRFQEFVAERKVVPSRNLDWVVCAACGGHGKDYNETCVTCAGSGGYYEDQKTGRRFMSFEVDEASGSLPMGMSAAPKDYKKCPECGGDGKSGGTIGWGQRRAAGVCTKCQGTGYVHKLQEAAPLLSYSDMLQKKIDKQNKRVADNRAAMAAAMAAAKLEAKPHGDDDKYFGQFGEDEDL